MKPVPMDLKSWRPKFHLPRKGNDSDGYTSVFYETHTKVKVFSFLGNAQHRPFTVLDAYFNDQLHQVTLDRFYHPRWHARLSRQFDEMIASVK